jgi:hypothetical protein
MQKSRLASHPELGNSPIEQEPIPRHKGQLEPVRDIVFWEEENPTSLINLVTERLRELMRQLPPSLLAMSERDIRKKLDPTWLHDQLRLAFWDEYFLTIDNNERKMRLAAIYSQCCSKEGFYNQIENPLFLAYLTKPPAGYMLKMRNLLDMAMERLREVLSLDLTNPNGTVNTKLIAEIVKIAALADNRVKGAVTQKIQIDGTQKNLNVNINQNGYEPPKTHQDLEKELKDIEREILQIKAPDQARNFMEESTEEDGREVIEVRATEIKT